jgi:DNA-directed RNA polymerase subunit RPC12/RpoP
MSAPIVSNRIWQANRAESIARGVECVMCGAEVKDEPGPGEIWFNEDATAAYGRCPDCTAKIAAEMEQGWEEAWQDRCAPATSALGGYTIWAGDA